VPDGFAHATNLAISALVDGDAKGAGRHHRHLRRCRDSILELDTAPEAGDVAGRRLTLDLGQVLLVDAEGGVCESVGEVAVVGQEQEPFGVRVEPADREDPGLVGDQIDDGGPPVGVARGGDDPGRLVQQVVDEVGRRRDRNAVDLDSLGLGVDPPAQLGNFPVDGDPAVVDELLARPPAPIAGPGENLLQPLPLLGAIRRRRGALVRVLP